MIYKSFSFFKTNNVFHYLPNIALYTVRFRTIKRLSVRFHFMLFRLVIEIGMDFKTK